MKPYGKGVRGSTSQRSYPWGGTLFALVCACVHVQRGSAKGFSTKILWSSCLVALFCSNTGLPAVLRWCVLSTEEIYKCSKMARAFQSKSLKPDIQCVSAQSPEQCMERIQVCASLRAFAAHYLGVADHILRAVEKEQHQGFPVLLVST